MQKKANEDKIKLDEERQIAQRESEAGAFLKGHLVTGRAKSFLQVMASQEDQDQELPSKYKKWPKQSEQQLEFDMAVTLFLVQCNLPFNLVENAGFKNFINYLCPRAHIKSRNAFSQWKLDLVWNNVKEDVDHMLKKDLKYCTQMALTSDGWTARNNEPFMSLTLHYITKDFRLQSLNLGCELMEERHTGK